jgi:two-component system, chemotaxis family, protein-glutamate methylesterase/glutaminase
VQSPPSKIVVVGASAGGIEALIALTRALPQDLAATVLAVVHVPATADSQLPLILARHTPLSVRHARGNEALAAGEILIAPPDHHMILRDGRVVLERGPKENGHRPAVDPLFRSAAVHDGDVIAAVLSGAGDDGAAGSADIVAAGGVVIVQDPRDAVVSNMPQSCARFAASEHVAPAARLGSIIEALVSRAGAKRGGAEPPQRPERTPMEPPMSCPDCGGALTESQKNGKPRYKCRVGHTYGPESLAEGQENAVEEALWHAIVVLRERAQVLRRLYSGAIDSVPSLAERYRSQLVAVEQRADLLEKAFFDPAN